MGVRIVAFSVTSPSCSSTPSAASAVAFAGDRTSARTWCPPSRNCRATTPPTNPVAPVMKAIISAAYQGDRSELSEGEIQASIEAEISGTGARQNAPDSVKTQPRRSTEHERVAGQQRDRLHGILPSQSTESELRGVTEGDR